MGFYHPARGPKSLRTTTDDRLPEITSGPMTHLLSPGAEPKVAKSNSGIAVFLRPTNVPEPVEEWIKIFNELAVGSAYKAGTEDEDLVIVVSFAGNEDQASTNAKLDAVVDLIAATDAQFEEVRSEELAMRSHVEDWWSRHVAKGAEH